MREKSFNLLEKYNCYCCCKEFLLETLGDDDNAGNRTKKQKKGVDEAEPKVDRMSTMKEETNETGFESELETKGTKVGVHDTSLYQMKKEIDTNKDKYDDESRTETIDDHVL